MTPGKAGSPKENSLPLLPPLVYFMGGRSGVGMRFPFKPHSRTRKHSSESPSQKRITCPGKRSLNSLWGTDSMTYKLMKSDLTAGQNGKQPKTTYPGLRAPSPWRPVNLCWVMCLYQCEPLLVLNSAPALSSPCLSATWVERFLTQDCTAKGCFSE